MHRLLKAHGFVRTPRPIAALLAQWAIRAATDHVLDAGFGEGVFLRESARRLLALGASRSQVAHQLHGVDADPQALQALRQGLQEDGLPAEVPGVFVGDLFASHFPPVDVLIGNPPYVRRWWQKDVAALQLAAEQELGASSRLTDLACYFIAYSARFLKPGGRLALIVSDSWLDMRYGKPFKAYLLRTFRLRGIVGFQSQVFPEVLVRPVMLLAEKRHAAEEKGPEHVPFVALHSRMPSALPAEPQRLLEEAPAATGTVVATRDLAPEASWTPYLYMPRAWQELQQQPWLTPLTTLAQARIGLQSFAKMFYLVSAATQQRWALERRWLRPFLMSPKDVTAPLVSHETPVRHFVVACDWSKEHLAGTRLLRYIEYWEQQVLKPRGLARPVRGVQNLPRLRKTRRRPWYNLLTTLERRGTAPVLVPRRIYQRYQVVWNQAGWVAGENFIELIPRPAVPLRPLLAVLNASPTEVAMRANAHLYGGGVYNLSPGRFGAVPVLDVRQLSPASLQALAQAYDHFLRSGGREREGLDRAVLAAVGLPLSFLTRLQAALQRMQGLASAVVEPLALGTTANPVWAEELRLL
ncbi:MAG: hypothetical protein KatS3mg131_2997 [Candidatus Tectimicrobiota bacterium]|nr:MAG: hypothetical protein KatS3mg131_2997 [Candidatus Tectomicrobia bacterium]